ncbi:MAG: hypothetical protein ACI4U5_03785, partial [Bacilli bacterium]
GLAIVFGVLFFLYSIYKRKHVSYGHEDETLKVDVDNKIKALEKRALKKGETLDKTNIKSIFLEKKAGKKVVEIIMDLFTSIIFGVLIVAFGFALVFKLNNQNLYIFDTTYIAIHTGSMETVNDSNTYIKENNLTDQIETYSLIGIDKVTSNDEIELYDIVAYKYKGTIYVHRVIRIYEDEETGVTCYTLRGDANSTSLSFEMKITLDDIVGRYSGYQNYGFGIAFIYLQSNIGIVALVSAMMFLLAFDFTEEKIEKTYDKRIEYILEQIEEKAKEESDSKLEENEEAENEEQINEESTELDNDIVEDNQSSLVEEEGDNNNDQENE